MLYTDGLVERRNEAIDAGIERLLATIGACEDPSPRRLVELVPRLLLENTRSEDDVCMLSFRRLGGANGATRTPAVGPPSR